MKDEEKNLIINLFHRLKNTELNSSERDNSADDLIQKLVKKQPASSYYMTQTILIQETAIKKMSAKIEELTQRIETLNAEELNKKPSFLSNFFKTNPTSQQASYNNNVWRKKNSLLNPQNSNSTVSEAVQTLPTATRTSSFLGNALQTATGVAGGMILGNMLMNIFNHTKPEEEIFDTINKENLNHHEHEEESFTNNPNHNDLVSYDQNESDINKQQLYSDGTNDNYDIDHVDDIEVNDDHFI